MPNPNAVGNEPDQPVRILMIEDSADDADLCMWALRQGGIAVHVDMVQDEADFRHRIAHSTYDVILSDNSMPRWSGRDALAVARQIAPEIPFILVTGSLGEEAAVEVMKRGAVDYIIKDRLTRLPDAVRRALAERHAAEEQRHAQAALRSSEKRFRALMDHEPGCVKVLDAEGRLLEMNLAGLRIVEAGSIEQILGKRMAELVAPEHREAFLSLTQKVIGGEPGELAFDMLSLTGKRRHLETRAVPFEMEGKPLLLGITRDVTEQRVLERKILQLEKFEAIGQLAGGVAHDFNNILGAILGWAELGLAEPDNSPAVREHFSQIFQQGTRAAMLTRQLLAFARRQILEPRDMSINQAILDMRPLIEKLLGAQVEIDLRLRQDAAAVRADAAQIEQIIMNLCVNARDAMPDGGKLTISTCNATIGEEYRRTHPYVQDGEYVRFAVEDTGIGMDAKTQERIFEPFFSTKAAAHGTGLGLATVYGIVRQHGGFLNVYSEVGRGSVFSVYLPAIARPAIVPRTEQPKQVRRGTETILVAEDHEGLRVTARASLEMLGYKPLMAADGEEAVRLFTENAARIDLVLLDVVMPRLSGPEAFRRITALRPDVPVIFSTGYGAESPLLKELLTSGTVAVLQKPFSVFALGGKIREVLERDASSASPS